MNKSIHIALWDWFLQCAAITKLFFNFSGAKDEDTVISTSGDMVLETYIDGSERRRYSFELIRYLPTTFEPNDSGNIDMLEDVEAIVDWARKQAAEGNLPALPDGCNAEELVVLDQYAGYADAQDGSMAKYMIPFAIDYMKG
jgi:hypothetical protein